MKQKLQRLQGKPERSLALLHGFKGVLSMTDWRRGQEITENMPSLNSTVSLLESDGITIQQQPARFLSSLGGTLVDTDSVHSGIVSWGALKQRALISHSSGAGKPSSRSQQVHCPVVPPYCPSHGRRSQCVSEVSFTKSCQYYRALILTSSYSRTVQSFGGTNAYGLWDQK